MLASRIVPVQPFFYGVKTTGVYCRCGCRSRLPRRPNVLFFDSAVEAEREGFRPCLRCRPRATAAPAHLAKVLKACRQIERSQPAPSLIDLARSADLSAFHFLRVFKSIIGLTPAQYAKGHRERISARPGVSAGSRRQWKINGIEYAKTRTRLGWLMVAATAQGICHIALADTPAELQSGLVTRFRHADIHANRKGLSKLLRQIVATLKKPATAYRLPLDIQGTVFQCLVWNALRTIPAGRTVTYGELAHRIGRPTAVRAVARACGANNLAIAVPCHRVIGRDGALTGYRWGVERKKQLLELEQARPGWFRTSR